MSDIDEIRNGVHDQLALAFGDKYNKLLEVVDGDRLSFPLYHVSTNKSIKAFIPRFSVRLFPGESTAIARVSTAPTVFQCVIGRGDPYHDLKLRNGKKPPENNAEYFVYDMDYRVRVIPNKKLVPDTHYTAENWLIAPNAKSRIYTGEIIGTFFFAKEEEIYLKDGATRDYTFYFKVSRPMNVIDGKTLQPGYYCIKVTNWMQPFMTFTEEDNVFITPIKEGEYLLNYNRRYKVKKDYSKYQLDKNKK